MSNMARQRRRPLSRRGSSAVGVVALTESLVIQGNPAFAQEVAPRLRPGFLTEALNAEHLAQTSTSSAPPALQQRRWIARHPVWAAAGIGAGSGLAIFCPRNAEKCGLAVLAGTGAGALTGVFVSHARRGRLSYETSGQTDVNEVSRIVATLGAGASIVVRTTELLETRGKIGGVRVDGFALIPEGQTSSVTVAFKDVRAVRPPGLGTGAKVGVAAGIISAILIPLVACYGAGGCGGVS
jgi:hypothetical protein